jgi:hypothetical protein
MSGVSTESEATDVLQTIAHGEVTKNTHDLARALLALPPKDIDFHDHTDVWTSEAVTQGFQVGISYV